MSPLAAASMETMRGWLPEPEAQPGPRRVRLRCKCGHSWRDTVPAAGTVTPCPNPDCGATVYTNRAEARERGEPVDTPIRAEVSA